MLNYKIVDREIIKKIPWTGDPIEYDLNLFKSADELEEFIVPNPNIAVDLDQIIKKIPDTNRCVVWYYQDTWIAKRFNNKWRPEYGYYDIQVPISSLKFNYLWIKNPDLEDLELDSDPYRKYIPSVDESYYELVWYLDPKYSPNDDKIWVVKCKNHNANCLGTKDMGYLSPPISIKYNPALPKLKYDIDYAIPWWDLKYTHQWMLAQEHCENALKEIWAYKISFCKKPEGLKVVGEASPVYDIEYNSELPQLGYDIEYSVPYHDLAYEHVWMLDDKHCENAVEDIWAVKIRYVESTVGTKIIDSISPILEVELNEDLPDLEYNIDYVIPYHDLAYEHVWMLDSKHCESAVEDIWAIKVRATKNIVGAKIVGEVSPKLRFKYNTDLPKMKYDIDYVIPYHDLAYEHVWMLDSKHCETAVEDIWAIKVSATEDIEGTKIVGEVSPRLIYEINKDIKGYDLEIPEPIIQYYDLDYNYVYMLDKNFSAGFDIWAARIYHAKTKKEKYIGDISPLQKILYNPDLKNLKIKIDYKIPYHDRFYEHVWYLDERFSNGDKIWAAKITACKDSIGEKEMGVVVPEINDQLDVIFISYNEPNAEENWQRVLFKAPYAKRVNGVKGIFEAHKTAAKLAESDMFYVIDGDAWLVDEWEFNFQPSIFDRDCCYVWSSQNPVNGLVYQNGGVKLFSKKVLLSHTEWKTLDMTNGIMSKIKTEEKISSRNNFNTDPFSAWRSAFRECVKLYITNQITKLHVWQTVGEDKLFGKYSIKGAIDAEIFAKQNIDDDEKLRYINDYEWLEIQFEKSNERQ